MRFIAATILFGLVASSLASPIPDNKHAKRGVLTQQSYDDFQISDGVAGNSVAEVLANFPVRFVLPQNATLSSYLHTNTSQIDTSDLAGVAASDLAIIQNSRLIAEAAETGAGGFDDELDATSGDTTPLQNGKIKNKVLKLQLEVLGLQIEQAQGKDTSSQITTETTKLNTNIALDDAAAGEPSVGVTATFDGKA
jgi:hypothetical protein